uniref:DUF4706 domain-containing protein n=1 Tax=Fundulus heteroclitus TaxID=8078 RepID=A0A3Q2PJC2_FUNHE
MAAATMAGLDAHRMEKKKFEYFSSINSMAKKIMQEREKIKAEYGSSWEKMSPQEQDSAIDNSLMDPHIRARYAMHKVDREEVVCYPKLLLQTGQKIVHFGEEVLKRHFSLYRKVFVGVAANNGHVDVTYVTTADSTWDKNLPSYLRQESSSIPKEPEAAESHPPAPAKSIKHRAPKPPAPQPPVPVAVSATPASISIAPTPAPPVGGSSSVAGWERSQSTLPSVSNTPDEIFSSHPITKPSKSSAAAEKEKPVEGSPPLDVSPTFSQFNTSSNILKTGFDFLDNW